jgi:uroporphyrinogen-III synthase
MQRKPIHIVCARTLSEELISIARSEGVEIKCYNFLQIQPKELSAFEDVLLTNTKPLVFTSKHAVEAVSPLLLKLNQIDCFAIEGNTSEKALSLGFTLLGTASDATQLSEKIIETDTKAVLHCTTHNRRDELKNVLQEAQIQYEAVEVYDKESVSHKVEHLDGLMFFSPSQIDAFLILNKLAPNQPAFCVGKTTAEHLANLNHINIHISKLSSEKELLHTLLNFYKKNNEQYTFTT